MSESAPPVSTEAPAGDAGLDATHTGDRAYLHELGYRQELRRALGFFSSFAVQWTCIAVAGGLALSSVIPARHITAERCERVPSGGRVTG